MAEYFRDFLDPAIDGLAFDILDSVGDSSTPMLARVGRSVFWAVGGTRLANSDDGERWEFPLPNSNGRSVIEFRDPAAIVAWLHGSDGALYARTGEDEPLWKPDTKFTVVPQEIRTDFPESDGLVVATMALHHAIERPRRAAQITASTTAWFRDGRALKRWDPSTERTKAEIMSHYDHDQAFYVGSTGILGPTKQYSSGLLLPGQRELDVELNNLQEQKIDSLLRKLDLENANTLLEVGSGWGELAIRAAKRYPHLHITSLTVSHEQAKLCREAAKAAGVDDQIEFLEKDYRDFVPEKPFDRVVSVEMIEAVAWQDLPAYYSALTKLTDQKRGVAVLQTINVRPEQEARQRHHKGFAQAIFPGGSLVAAQTIERDMSKYGWQLYERTDATSSYGPTLRGWRVNLHTHEAARTNLRIQKGISETSSARSDRGFDFYLAASETGFRTGYIENHQLVFKRS